MTSVARDMRDEQQEVPSVEPAAARQAADAGIVRIPGITAHAFCETPSTAEALENAAADRRMSRASMTVRQGGVRAATRLYRDTPTPNLVIVQSTAAPEALFSDLDALALVCDTATKVVVIGEWNDIALYRELLKRGISEYLQAPVDPMTVILAVSSVFAQPDARKLGRVSAFIGAKGGVGSSSVAQNVAWLLGRHSGTDVILADMDLPFGTASLNFDLEPTGGIAEAVRETGRLDDQMLERLLVRCDEHLQLLAAPALLDKPCDLDADAFDGVIELAQASASHLVLDMPHLWTAWSRKTLLAADEVVITATPDLASLRNARHLVEILRHVRSHDPAPRLVLNQVGMPERPEIAPAQFAESVGLEPVISLPFDAKAFGSAANQGRMVAELSRQTKTVAAFRRLAECVSGRPLRRRSRFAGVGRLFHLMNSSSHGG